MFNKVEFIQSVNKIEDLPKIKRPEVFMLGRSNVGKSSFINNILNRKQVAYVSSRPGKTVSLNYYEIDKQFYIVDAPGYGFAKRSQDLIEKWDKFLIRYFSENETLSLIVHLIDALVGPTELDIESYRFINSFEFPYLCVLTKSDKLNQSESNKSLKIVQETFPELVYNQNLFFYSSVKGTNKNKIQSIIQKSVLNFKKK